MGRADYWPDCKFSHDKPFGPTRLHNIYGWDRSGFKDGRGMVVSDTSSVSSSSASDNGVKKEPKLGYAGESSSRRVVETEVTLASVMSSPVETAAGEDDTELILFSDWEV